MVQSVIPQALSLFTELVLGRHKESLEAQIQEKQIFLKFEMTLVSTLHFYKSWVSSLCHKSTYNWKGVWAYSLLSELFVKERPLWK